YRMAETQLSRAVNPPTPNGLAFHEPQDFQVLRTLGTGAFGSVFLARQRSLNRLVALKVSPNRGCEARTLASLEHDHIVRVFSESVDPEQGRRLLCMQYVPGTTLEHVVEYLAQRPSRDWTGQTVLEAIDAQSGDSVALDLSAQREREFLSSLDHVD